MFERVFQNNLYLQGVLYPREAEKGNEKGDPGAKSSRDLNRTANAIEPIPQTLTVSQIAKCLSALTYWCHCRLHQGKPKGNRETIWSVERKTARGNNIKRSLCNLWQEKRMKAEAMFESHFFFPCLLKYKIPRNENMSYITGLSGRENSRGYFWITIYLAKEPQRLSTIQVQAFIHKNKKELRKAF